jgi:circadian clock protein KaiC
MTAAIERLETGIPGFDQILQGGLPKGRSTLVAGTSGSAKTVLAAQFIAEGIRRGEPGVFVTFEETPEDLRRNMHGFNWPIEDWEKEKKWSFVDASARGKDRAVIVGDYDFGALLARVEHAVKTVGAKRVALDSLGAVFITFTRTDTVRGELLRLTEALKEMGVTSVITVERLEDYGPISRFGVEEFVTDNVVILRNTLEQEKRRRTMEVLKLRGVEHGKGEYPFTVIKGEGIIGVPLSALELRQRSSSVRVSSGNDALDAMCGGGFFRDSVVLASGATGTGKTLMVTEFLGGGAKNGQKSLLFAFEESREQLFRNAVGWSQDFERLEKEGLLKVVCVYPETQGLEDHLICIKRCIEEYQPSRVAIDSLSALERVSTNRGFREFVIGITSYIKQKEIVGLFTSTTEGLMGGSSITEAHISTITDTIILLRYIEMYGEMRRGLTVLKMRGSKHEKEIREMTIDETGMHIGKPFRNVTGVLTGRPMYLDMGELEQLDRMFRADHADSLPDGNG